MQRTEQLQGLRLMKFGDLSKRWHSGELSQLEASEILGISERTFRRWQRRYEHEGAEGLFDRRLGCVSGNKVPVDTLMAMLDLFDTDYFDHTAKHFHEALVEDHQFKFSYNWVRLALQAHGRIRPAPRRGAHRRKRPRRACAGMMIHQDGSSHEWVPGLVWDLIVTMDDATSEIYSAFFVDEEGTHSSFQGLSDVVEQKGLFCSFYSDRGSHYFHTPEAGGRVDKTRLTQVGKALERLGIEHIPAYSPEARGRSERMFGTLQGRLPQELRRARITTMRQANEFLRDVFLPRHNRQFARQQEGVGSAFVPFTGNIRDYFCIQEDRTVAADNTIRYKRLSLQIPKQEHRHHYVKARVTIHEYPDRSLAIFHGPRCLVRFDEKGQMIIIQKAA